MKSLNYKITRLYDSGLFPVVSFPRKRESRFQIRFDFAHGLSKIEGKAGTTFYINCVILVLFGLFWGTSFCSAKSESMDKNFIIGRAIALANFQNNEKIVEPEIKYKLAGEGILQNIFFDQSQKIITIVDPQFAIGGIQAVFKAPKYEIQDGKKTYSVYSFKRGVGEVISGANIVLAKEDMVTPALDAEPSDNSIKITRVSLAEIEDFETLPYQTKKIDDPNLERGKQVTSQIGKTGKRRLLYLVRREDGIDISKTLQKNEIVDKPQDEIIKIGTKVIVLSSERGYATVYNPPDCSVVSANYKKGTILRITNQSNGAQIIKTVDCTWGSADHDSDVVLDLSHGILDELRYNWTDKGARVLVEQLKQ